VHLLGYFPEFQRWAGGQEQQVLEVQRLFLSDLSPSGVAQSLFLIAMVPALMEELYFRGALQRIMGQFITNGWITIILGGLVFSLIHFQFEGFLSRWMLGSMLGWVAWKTGKIWPSVLLHFMNNALSILFFHLQGQQMNTAEDHWSQHGIVGTISLACLVMLPYIVWKKERKTNATTRAFF
jgi:membrane protease YdiL (CAAX protease family)